MDAAALSEWLAALDSISYYELFRISPDASHDDIRAAFREFAGCFHPDLHRGRDPEEQSAVGVIYRRGTEAYRVLSEPALRSRYDEALANGMLRPEDLVVDIESPAASARPVSSRSRPELRSPGARHFVLRAEELMRNGDPKQAKIQLVMAMHIDRGNAALEQYARELDEAIAAKNEEDRKAGRKA